MSSYKEIVAKTVIGKGKKTFTNTYNMQTEQKPNTILGCWIINHKFSGINNKNDVHINGNFDLNVWYSFDNDTKTSVSTKTFSYDETMKLKVKDLDSLTKNNEIIVRSLKQPTVQDVKINNDLVEITIEKELGAEIVGESKVKVAIEEDELPWDDVYEEDNNSNLKNLNEKYIQENNS